MTKLAITLAMLAIVTGSYIWFATPHWYTNMPGVAETGPLNQHFAKDVALAYLVSGGAVMWGALRAERSVAVFGSLWLVFHAVFHIAIWINRGSPSDVIALTNLLGIQIPAALTFFTSFNLPQSGYSS